MASEQRFQDISMFSKEQVFFTNLDKAVLSNQSHDQFFENV